MNVVFPLRSVIFYLISGQILLILSEVDETIPAFPGHFSFWLLKKTASNKEPLSYIRRIKLSIMNGICCCILAATDIHKIHEVGVMQQIFFFFFLLRPSTAALGEHEADLCV